MDTSIALPIDFYSGELPAGAPNSAANPKPLNGERPNLDGVAYARMNPSRGLENRPRLGKIAADWESVTPNHFANVAPY